MFAIIIGMVATIILLVCYNVYQRPVSVKTMSTMELQMPALPALGHEDSLPFPMGFDHDGEPTVGHISPNGMTVKELKELCQKEGAVPEVRPATDRFCPGARRSHKGPQAQRPPDNLKSKKVHVKQSIQPRALLLGDSATGDAAPPPAVERSKDTRTQAEKVAINP
ncbi:hypothetical protein BDN67DRAFT_984218 [Paxillus ammoniavirescens]|nr:hypothetical protein BDN67DRAFT_984218 [Paxillus ammoniavirescens]